MNYMVVITFWAWLFATDFFSLIYMSVYSHVTEVGTFLNWSPTLFSIASTLLLIGAFAWNYLVGWTLEMKLLLGASVTGLKFVSIIILTVLNALAVDENNDGTLDQELRPGSEEDIESMIRIMAIISSLHNWLMMLVTILLVICLIYDTKIFKFWKFNERRERKLQKIPEEEDEIAKLHARLQALKS